MVWIGIDTGGTFTDLVMADLQAAEYRFLKVPSTNDDPSRAILDGLQQLLEDADRRARVEVVVHGTTVATNAILEGKLPGIGVVTTRGFRDIIELARQRRPHTYDLEVLKPQPPAPRNNRLEVDERIAYDGEVVVPLDEDQVLAAAQSLQGRGLAAVAVCFLNSYANRDHEERAKEIIAKEWPNAYLCTSTEVLGEYREFERFATAMVNASLLPVMDSYLRRFERGLEEMSVTVPPRVMQSNGGVVSPSTIRRLPINTFFSGPAAGVIGAGKIAKLDGEPDLITFDMGGTSTDVCLIRNSQPAMRSQGTVAGYPVHAATLDIHTVGAGGGSIAWRDPGGLMKVGPQSAGAVPGPAAYGRGGTLPTVSDANVVLGRLNPQSLLAGEMPIYPERAQRAVGDLAAQLQLEPTQVAAGIIDIVNTNMMGAIRVISVDQGEDPRDYTLVAFGGAGPLHAVEVAQEMGISRVLIPPSPGLLSALGLLHADLRGDFSVTCLAPANQQGLSQMQSASAQLATRGSDWLAAEGKGLPPATMNWSADVRYLGQNYQLAVQVTGTDWTVEELDRLVENFHEAHLEMYGFQMTERQVEVVNLRLSVTTPRPAPEVVREAMYSGREQDQAKEREVWFAATGFTPTPVLSPRALQPGHRREGPLIVEQMDSTVVVPPGASLTPKESGSLVIDLSEALNREGTS